MRIRSLIRAFFLDRVLDGNTSAASVDRGVNRFMGEMLPLLENLESLVVRDNIDIIRSSQLLFRTRLPNIISLAASRNPNSLRMLVDQCSITMRQLCALVLYASANGQQGVEDVLDHIVVCCFIYLFIYLMEGFLLHFLRSKFRDSTCKVYLGFSRRGLRWLVGRNCDISF